MQKSNSQFKLDVDPVLQLPELPTGCEITSLATVLNYYGYDISKTQLADEYLECGEVGDTDPNEKFIGSPYDIHSCGCFSNVIADAAKSFSEKNGCNFKVYNLYGLSLDDLYKYVEDGKPVVIWSTIDLKETYRNITWDVDGKEIAWRANEHCMVLIGYDKDNNTCIVSDPLQGIKEYPRDLFNQRYEELGKQAVVVEKVFNMWDFEKDSDKTCFDHLGDYIPESIANEAKRELRRRGYSEEKIREEEWKRTK